jgi:hypothetical protein
MIYVYIAIGIIALTLIFLILNKLGTIGFIALILAGLYFSGIKK